MTPDIHKQIEKRRQLEHLVDITFYIPCCNEEYAIIPTLTSLVSLMRSLPHSYELLLYNDGSTDGTQQKIERYAREHPKLLITLVHTPTRKGLGFNYIDGAFRGLGTYYMMICGDNSETPASIRRVLDKLGTADIIIPYFGNRDTRSFFRRLLSRTFTGIVNFINGYSLQYYNGIVLHERYNVMRWHPTSSGFAYQAELLSALLDHHKTYYEVQISNTNRTSGRSKAFSVLNTLSVAHSLLQIFFRRIRRTIWPV